MHEQGVAGLDELLIEQMGDAVGDAVGAGVAALWVDAGVGRQRDAVGKPCIAGGDDDGDVGNARIGGKAVERVLQHGDAEQGGVLFGLGCAVAAADACGGDKGDVGHGNLSGWVCGFQAALMRTGWA